MSHCRIVSEDGAVEVILAPSVANMRGIARDLRRVLQKTMRVYRGDGLTWERIPEATFKARRWPAGWLESRRARSAAKEDHAMTTTITNKQIEALGRKARKTGDLVLAATCQRALDRLGGTRLSDWEVDVLSTMSVEAARAQCAMAAKG